MLQCADMGMIVRLRHSLFFVSAKAGPCYLFQIILAQSDKCYLLFPQIPTGQTRPSKNELGRHRVISQFFPNYEYT